LEKSKFFFIFFHIIRFLRILRGFCMKTADILLKIRNEKGWTQKDLATKLGITQAALSKIEGGASNPSVKVLSKIRALAPKYFEETPLPSPDIPATLSAEMAQLINIIAAQQRTIEAQADTIRLAFKGRSGSACG
jgi:transcriptional regulator with XRE-family HTH domain